MTLSGIRPRCSPMQYLLVNVKVYLGSSSRFTVMFTEKIEHEGARPC
jgi:hypothetical protein